MGKLNIIVPRNKFVPCIDTAGHWGLYNYTTDFTALDNVVSGFEVPFKLDDYVMGSAFLSSRWNDTPDNFIYIDYYTAIRMGVSQGDKVIAQNPYESKEEVEAIVMFEKLALVSNNKHKKHVQVSFFKGAFNDLTINNVLVVKDARVKEDTLYVPKDMAIMINSYKEVEIFE